MSFDQRGMWDAVQRVRARWESAYPRVADGGANALAGFDYQFLIVLRDTVRRWLAADTPKTQPEVFTEILSDVVDLSAEGPVHVTQVKRTQSGSTVRAALEDLWRIHELLFVSESGLAGTIEYRIVSAYGRLREVGSIVSQWLPPGVPDTARALCEFRDRVSVEIDEDPESELLTLLASECLADEPLIIVHRWLGRLIHASAAEDGFIAASREIWSDLHALHAASDRNRSRGAIYVWQGRDQPPEAVSRGQYLTGERPTPRHLRLGFFARREHVIDPLKNAVLFWLTPHPAANDASLRVPVFWIGGRSGTGKSVALLNVLAYIRREQIGPVLWLGPHVAALPDAIRWGQKLRRPDETLVIGLDDPYAPAVQHEALALWQQAIAEMNTLRQGDDPTSLPVLICCGPTEQAERFERDFVDDMRLTREDLPHEDSKDYESLREWFRERTGTEAPDPGDSNVLLVQLFFQWKVGALLPEFARRLRLRIEAAEEPGSAGELVVQFSRILALNRLYVGYPSRAVSAKLTPTQQSVFLRLQRENHLVVDPDDARPGMWLAHPHLSDAIYTAWYAGSSVQPVRTDHLREGILSAIDYGENPSQQQSVLWAISRALDETPKDSNVRDRLSGVDLLSLLSDIHRTLIARYHGVLPQTHLPVWIEIRVLSSRLSLSPDPIEAGIETLHAATPQSGLRLTVHKLLRHLSRHNEQLRGRIIRAVIDLLEQTTGWYEWPPLMLDALRQCRTPELGTMTARWALAHRSQSVVPIVLQSALKWTPCEDIRAAAIQLVERAGEGIAWGDVTLSLLDEDSTSIPEEIAAWAQNHRLTFGACWVLGRLLSLRHQPATVWGIDWTRVFHLERTANWVLEPLISCHTQASDIVQWAEAWVREDYPNAGRLIKLMLQLQPSTDRFGDLALEWLQRRQASDKSWSYAWEGLWHGSAGDAELTRLGMEWLEASFGHGSWAFVWEALAKQFPNDNRLRELGLRWTSASLDHGSWPFVWQALDKATPGDAKLRELGLSWLTSAPVDHGSWSFMWLTLDEAVPGDVRLGELGLNWLTSVPVDHGSWAFVWQALDKAVPGDAKLRELGLSWLASASVNHGSWHYVWRALDYATPGDAKLRELGLSWLTSAPIDHGSWPFVWLALDKATPGDAKLRELGLSWLTSVPVDHGSWSYVWRALDHATPGDTKLRELGLSWLTLAPVDHRWWAFVWQALDKAVPGDAELRELGLSWLASASVNHGSWHYVWRALDYATPGDAKLRELGLSWLTCAPVDHGSWPFVWQALDKAVPCDARLGELGLNWLTSVPVDHGSWAFVWQALNKAVPGDAKLRELGQSWLASVSVNHGSWQYVWSALDMVAPGDRKLRELALRWLDNAIEHKSWTYVWLALWSSSVNDDELTALGKRFLQATAHDHFRRWTVESALGVRPSGNTAPAIDSLIHWIDDWERGCDHATLIAVGRTYKALSVLLSEMLGRETKRIGDRERRCGAGSGVRKEHVERNRTRCMGIQSVVLTREWCWRSTEVAKGTVAERA